MSWRDEDPMTWIGKDFNFSMAPKSIVYRVLGIINHSEVEIGWFVDHKLQRSHCNIEEFRRDFELCQIVRPINSSL